MLRSCRLPLQLRPVGNELGLRFRVRSQGLRLEPKTGVRSKINPSLAQKHRQCRVNFCHLSLRLKPLVLRVAAPARSKERCRLPSPRSGQGASTCAYRPDPPGPVSCAKAAGPSSRSGPPNLRLGQLALPAPLLSPPVRRNRLYIT